ncbi:hypothetical protein [[Clostridium] aminophilum]|uniref:hypothetical protein n=1 Tax=[Clostridium] aminophilum TaxID=1526 RepID=UPI003333519E
MKKRYLRQGMSIATVLCLAVGSPFSAAAAYKTSYEIEKNDGKTLTHEGDISSKNGGIHADNGSTVEQKGNVSAGEKGVRAENSSKVDVSGNVSSGGTGVTSKDNSRVDVKGNVEVTSQSENQPVEAIGVDSRSGSASVKGSVAVEAEGKATEKWAVSATGAQVYEQGKAEIDGDLTARAKDISTDSGSEGAEAAGVRMLGGQKEPGLLIVNGDVTAEAESRTGNATATGVMAGLEGKVLVRGDVSASAAASDAKEALSAGIVSSSFDTEGTYNTDIVVEGSVAAGLYGAAVEGNLSNTNFFVGKDLSGREGLYVTANWKTVNLVVDGTLKGEENAIQYHMLRPERIKMDPQMLEEAGLDPEGELNVTVWKMESGKELVKATQILDMDDGKPKETTDDKEKSEEILRNVNYIIRTDEVDHGVIRLSGTTKVVGNGKEYDTAKETQEVIIRVETADGYQLDAVKNGDALLTKNADGSYTLVVPRGGGIELSAVLSAIKKNENETNGASDDSGNPPAGYGEENGSTVTSASGAAVTRTVTEEGGIKTSLSKVEIGGKTAEVATRVTVENGQSRTLRTVSGDIAGVSFRGVGTVSADGLSVALEDGRTFAVISAPSLMITENGVTRGYFLNADGTGPIATGKTEVYYCLGEDGQLHAHWVDPNGYFYVGTVEIDGQTHTFNDEGEEVSSIA